MEDIRLVAKCGCGKPASNITFYAIRRKWPRCLCGKSMRVEKNAAINVSNYNNLYTNGAVLAYWTADRANLAALQTASGKDQQQILFSLAKFYRKLAHKIEFPV